MFSNNLTSIKNQENTTKSEEVNQIRIETDVRISRQDIKAVIITVFHVFKMLNRDIEIQKDPNGTSIA